ncbi:MAG: hypothetical protein Q4C14_02505 [Bacillota bacterium]|nr:hypothetical protein [Bacillota bacterium]
MKKRIISFILALVLCICSSSVIFAEEDSAYSIISPYTSSEGVAYGDNLLVSVRVSENTALRFTLYTYPGFTGADSLADIPAMAFTESKQLYASEDFEKRESINYYTKQLNNIKPGLYSLKIDMVDDNGELSNTYSKYFIVQPNSSRTATAIYESKPSSKVLFFQSVFKSLFGSAAEE